MPMEGDSYKTIGDEIKMSSFKNEFQRVYLNILFTANYLSFPVSKGLKKFGLTTSQYNVLRILRGQKGKAISAVDIQSRMIYPNSNVTRILEKLEGKGLIECHACRENRRKNNLFITEKGLELLADTEHIPLSTYRQIEKSITSEEASAVNLILDKLRNDINK